jgi:hypothetical protein
MGVSLPLNSTFPSMIKARWGAINPQCSGVFASLRTLLVSSISRNLRSRRRTASMHRKSQLHDLIDFVKGAVTSAIVDGTRFVEREIPELKAQKLRVS